MSGSTRGDPRGFASDNRSGVLPEVMEAMLDANSDHAASYGEDRWTERFDEIIRHHFGDDAAGFPVFNGTGANVLAIDALTRPQQAVICAKGAHIDVDECGAPERYAGVKLLTLETDHGKLSPDDLDAWEARRGDEHFPQPGLVSVADATEVGTVYTPAELRALADRAHELGMRLHVDGARLANAAASLDVTFAELTTNAGVDAVSLGATKNGAMGAEAVVFTDAARAEGFKFIRKQGMQLGSKMRFTSAQFEALLGSDLWKRNASHANAMASRLGEGVEAADGAELVHPVQANGVFAKLPRPVIDHLMDALPGDHPFYVWDEDADVVRWMCSWDTAEEDVEHLLEELKKAL